ncbi:AfsR/SARP family transcriptional regulator [Hamadaea tsunoensis]|uniref:AfsR/SARP family transcriptional regulator n=1 Tax=Hamadaea tsunoensis TaxID=53368 RepID=UPI00042529D0|nr:AfsR/SARP family transcriptional regulator [Hamadaea tsunoensis]
MLDVSLLGPTEARVAGVNVTLSPLERNLLALLALSRGTVLSTERIIDSLWGDRHPASPRSRVQGLVSSIRRKIGDPLITRHPGYLLDAKEITLDLTECEDLARQARLAGSLGQAAQYLRKALGLWRGEPLDGVTAPGLEADRVRLHELRIALLEERFAADLELGRHADIVAEIGVAVAAHPLREQLAGQLMLALYRCNRQADALRAYQALRDRLADELGADPSADLRNLHAMILRGEPDRPAEPHRPGEARDGRAGDPPDAGLRHEAHRGAAPQDAAHHDAAHHDTAHHDTAHQEPAHHEHRPAQLPAGVGHFTGRDAELDALTRAICAPAEESRVLVVAGAGGLGKTALVVRWAHSVAERYPEGQIFVDLHARVRDEELTAGNALAAALGALGVARDAIPARVDERAALYRTLTSGRRMLIVADDARSVEQLLPLVPPTAASQLVATSRRGLAALAAHHAVQTVHLEPLGPQATRDLLARVVGADRLRDPAAARLLQWCGGWPLAIRMAGTKLAARPWQSLAAFADELEEQPDLALEDDPRSAQAPLLSAYRALSPAARHLFGRIGLLDSPSVRLRAEDTGSGVDLAARRLRVLFDELVDEHLLLETGPDRYRVHDFVRRFARHCAAELRERDAVDAWVRPRVATGDEPRPSRTMADSYQI